MSDIRKQLDILFSKWRQKELHSRCKPFIKDGIVNEDIWQKNTFDKKFLFVLKEAYGKNDENDWYLNDWLNEEDPKDPKDPKGYKQDQTWKVIIKWVRGLRGTTNNYILPYDANYNDYSILKKIAVMNLKKSNGKPQSNNKSIKSYVTEDKYEIIKEIELIDPGVIISCTNKLYIDDICNNSITNKKPNDSGFYYSSCIGKKNRLFIGYNHPAAHIKKSCHYYKLMKIYQQALINKNIIK